MPVRALRVLTWLSIAAILVADYIYYSAHTAPLSVLYLVPVLLASLTESALLVVSVSILVISLDLIGIVVSRQPLLFGGSRLINLLIVCYLAVQNAGERALIRRTVQVEERAKWAMLIADIAHELRTPLTVVLGYTERLEADPRLPSPLHPTVVTVKGAAQRMRGAIDTIVERGKAGNEPQDRAA
jgi:signal transduction histidine kinase